jgi:hypothetical protein
MYNIFEDHNGSFFNLVGLPVKKKLSVHKDHLHPEILGEDPELKHSLLEIEIVK